MSELAVPIALVVSSLAGPAISALSGDGSDEELQGIQKEALRAQLAQALEKEALAQGIRTQVAGTLQPGLRRNPFSLDNVRNQEFAGEFRPGAKRGGFPLPAKANTTDARIGRGGTGSGDSFVPDDFRLDPDAFGGLDEIRKGNDERRRKQRLDDLFSDDNPDTRSAFFDALKDAGVPGFARGGLVTKPTLAVVGEEGPEVVAPVRPGGIPLPPQARGGAVPDTPGLLDDPPVSDPRQEKVLPDMSGFVDDPPVSDPLDPSKHVDPNNPQPTDFDILNDEILQNALKALRGVPSIEELRGNLGGEIASSINQSSAARGAFGGSANQTQIADSLGRLNLDLIGKQRGLQSSALSDAISGSGSIFGQDLATFQTNLDKFYRDIAVQSGLEEAELRRQISPFQLALSLINGGDFGFGASIDPGGSDIGAAVSGSTGATLPFLFQALQNIFGGGGAAQA